MNTTMTNAEVGMAEGVRGASEGPVARAIEERTSKLPSDLFLWTAGIAILGSLVLESMTLGKPFRFIGGRMFSKPRFANLSLFVGQWAPTLLLLGIYNKIVKVAGSGRRV